MARTAAGRRMSAGLPLPAPLRALLARPVLANSAALVALRATNLAARLGLLFVIARLVPPAEFGMVVFALSIVEIAKVVSDFGMDTLAIREYAVGGGASGSTRFAGALAASKLVLGSIVYVALAAYFMITQSPAQAELGLVIGLSTFTALLINFSLDHFQARLSVIKVLPRVVLLNLGLTAAAVLALPQIGDLRLKALCFPVIELAGGGVLLLALRHEELLGKPAFLFGGISALVRRSLPIALTGIVIMVYSRLDVLVLASRLGETAVAYYGIAFRLTEPFQLAAAAFGMSVFSRFSALFQGESRTSLRPTAVRYVAPTLGYGLVAALVVGWLAPPLVTRWLPAYAAAVPILRILAGALVFRTMNATLAGILLGAGRFQLLTALAVWNLALTYALLMLLVPRFGAPGAAWAALLGEAFNMLLHAVLVTRTIAARERTVAHAG